MGESFRFDDRVVVVTGAGRGLGRAHAELFAARGAKVVINDLGGTKEGEGSDAGPAVEAVQAILDAGGTAVADTNNVGSEAGCQALIEGAIAEFGRIDVLVNNAGISRWASFPEADAENLELTLDVHLRGSWHATRAAWPHFQAQGYGRVINTVSTGMLGLPDNLAYATAKGALIGFTRALAATSQEHGILVNAIAPNAVTRPSTSAKKPNIVTAKKMDADRVLAMQTDLVSPMIAYLAHESSDINGEIMVAGAKRFSRWFQGFTPGWLDESDGIPTVEAVAEHWSAIVDEDGYFVPGSTNEWGARFMSHLA